jgi:hypothetical protein
VSLKTHVMDTFAALNIIVRLCVQHEIKGHWLTLTSLLVYCCHRLSHQMIHFPGGSDKAMHTKQSPPACSHSHPCWLTLARNRPPLCSLLPQVLFACR